MPRSTTTRSSPNSEGLSSPFRSDRKSTRLNSSHTVIYTLSLHDALPILGHHLGGGLLGQVLDAAQHHDALVAEQRGAQQPVQVRSEEHTSELQSHSDLHSFPTRRSSDLRPPPRRRPPWTGPGCRAAPRRARRRTARGSAARSG